MRFGSLFAGIGGFDLGLERAGMECAWQVEIDPFCLKVLEKHWPHTRRYTDVREVHGALRHGSTFQRDYRWDEPCIAEMFRGKAVAHAERGWREGEFYYGGGEKINVNHGIQVNNRASGIPVESSILCPSCLPSVDLICGGFPCQPFSVAGKQRGKEDDRHLWPEMFRIVSELRPAWVVGENVPGLVRLGLDEVLSDLEGIGYSTQTFDIPACAVDAPHVRHRIWIVAHSNNDSKPTLPINDQWKISGAMDREDVAYCCLSGLQGFGSASLQGRGASTGHLGKGGRWLPEPELGRVAHGIPRRVDRLRSLGNAVVPQVVEVIGRAIMAVEERR